MRFEDKDDGEYRIHAGALELRAGQGFVAAVVVSRIRGALTGSQEVYRDTADSRCWATSDEALAHALGKGAMAVRVERAQSRSKMAAMSDPPPMHVATST